MALTDAQGVPVSTTNPAALDAYHQALIEFHSYFGDPIATIETALDADPGFVLGHAFRATMYAVLGEAQFLPQIREAVESAEALGKDANDRERRLTQAARRWLEGNWEEATHIWENLLVDYPRDAFALQSAHLSDFFRGDALNLRDRVARVLPQWSTELPSYSYLLGMQSFGFEECNQFERAEQLGRQALEIEPRDPWAIHAIAHVLEMQNRYDEGIEFYNSREQNWAPDNGFAFHNWWHLALYHMERKEYARVLELFDTQISPEPSDIALTLLDGTALLWRLHLNDVDVGGRWASIADKWAEKSVVETGHYAFNDVHAVAAFVAADRLADAEALTDELSRGTQKGGDTNTAMTRQVGLPVARALVAFARGDYRQSVDLLTRVRPIANRFGGSNAQRDLLSQTLIEAAIRSGDHQRARHLLNERITHKPQSPLAWRYLARAHRQAGDDAQAKAVDAKANTFIRPAA